MSENALTDVRVGQQVPDFTLVSEKNEEWRLSDKLGNVVVLLFYPQSETLVCTRQLCSVRDNWNKYLETKAEIVGISPAGVDEHREFAANKNLPLSLLADPERSVTKHFAKHALFPINLTRGVIVVDGKGVVRTREVMLRAFRPNDDELITAIYAARGDALTEQYARLRARLGPLNR